MKFMTFTEINEKLVVLVRNERQITHEILNHILLFQKCDSYLKLGYPSMHQYLTRGLGYSDDQAYRRLKAARLINELPEVANQFQAAKLNLSQMAEAQKAFETSERETKVPINKEMKTALIANIEKTNNFQTKSILATELKLKPETKEKINPQSDETVRLELSLTKEQFEKLQTIKNLVSHQIPDLNTSKVLEMLCDFYISKKQKASVKTADVTIQAKAIKINSNTNIKTKTGAAMTQSFMDSMKQSDRNEKVSEKGRREHNMSEQVNESQDAKFIETNNSKVSKSKSSIKRSRYISVAIKKALFEKSQGCCEYVGPTGVRCNGRYQIQIDHHHQAFCFGGGNTIENLRYLCAQHNKLAAIEKGIGFETTSYFNRE